MIETRCEISSELAQPLEDFFCELIRSPWLLYHESIGKPYYLMGYFDSEAEALDAWADLRKSFDVLPTHPSISTLEDRDWKEAYKANLHPWNYKNLHWVPDWRRSEYKLPKDDAVVYFDAGLAFGTGDHPTTRLCGMRLIDFAELRPADQLTIIDAGCGSGILAISAAQIGCKKVSGFDRDPEAVQVSIENLEKNNLSKEAVSFTHEGLETGLTNYGPADIVLANIISDVLCIYADNLIASIKDGGVLVLSGILAQEQEHVKHIFETKIKTAWGKYIVDGRIMGEWSDLAFFKK